MSSRTNFRLALDRERSTLERTNKDSEGFAEDEDGDDEEDYVGGFFSQHQRFSSSTFGDGKGKVTSSSNLNLKAMANHFTDSSYPSSSNNSSNRNSPNSFRNSPITFGFGGQQYSNANRTPPRIIHVQAQNIVEEMGRKNLTLSNSLPPGLTAQNSPPKTLDNGRLALSPNHNVSTDFQQYHHQFNDFYSKQQQQQVNKSDNYSSLRMLSLNYSSRTNIIAYNGAVQLSPDEFSQNDYVDSPTSASYTSAQSELDDVIIDEILSMEEEQKLRNKQPAFSSNNQLEKTLVANSFSYADNLQNLLLANNNNNNNNNKFFCKDLSKVSFNRQLSTSAPTSTFDIETLVRDEFDKDHDAMRDRRKKDVHNMIERRRRYNINDRIKELGSLLPKSCTEEMKMNKGSILRASVDYIRVLRKDQEYVAHVQKKQHVLEIENKKMLQRIQDLEQELKTHGLPLPVTIVADTKTSSSSSLNAAGVDHYSLLSRPIKTEPLTLSSDDNNEPPTPQAALLNGVHITAHPLSPYHSWNNMTAAVAPRCHDFNPLVISGHNYTVGSNACGGDVRNYYVQATSTSSGNDFYGSVDVLLSSNNNNAGYGGGHQHQQQHHQMQHHQTYGRQSGVVGQFGTQIQIQDNDRCLQDLISDLNCENLTSTVELLSSTHDPLISAVDTSVTSQLIDVSSSPDVHWDNSSLSPDMPTSDKMDFITA